MKRLTKVASVFLTLIMMFTLIPAGTVFASTSGEAYSGSESGKPVQSETEFIVAIDPELTDQVISDLGDLTAPEDKTGGSGNQKADKNPKKAPPGLLKKSSNGKDVHIRNLERYISKHNNSDPVLVVVEIEDKNMMQEARAAAEKCEGVLYTDPLAYFYTDEFSDPRVSEQWGLTPIDAYDAWNGNSGLSGITIAVLDTGVRLTHEDLAGNILAGWDFIDNDSDPKDENGHGTHVAGIAAALCNNGKGIASPAGGAKILPVRVLNAGGSGDVLSISDGIRYAADKGADIINLSLGGVGDTRTLRLAVEYAQSRGCLLVASAGNNNSTLKSYPAAYNGVIVAASISRSPNPDHPYAESFFSNYNDELAYRTIHAPGENILSTYNNGDSSYSYMSGTSMSAPYISGMAAALKAKGGYNGSLYDALLSASVTVPRALLDSSGGFFKISGEMKILNDNGLMTLPDFSGRLKLIMNSPKASRFAEARVEARDNSGVINTSFSGTAEVSFVKSPGFWVPMFGSPEFTTYVQNVELKNGVGTTLIDMAGYNNNDYIYLWAIDPSGKYARSEKVTMTLSSTNDFKGCNVEISVDKPDNYAGPSSLPTGSDKFELQVYISYFKSIDSEEAPSGMSSAGASDGRLKWDPVKEQYRGTLNLTRGKIQLYYYVYYNGSDQRYPNPEPIGKPVILTSDGMAVKGKLLPYENQVAFEPNGGKPAPQVQRLPAGGLVTPPPTINREGYIFKGWYDNPGFSGAPYDFNTRITSSMTLYAKWDEEPPNCRIGQNVYQTLSKALSAAKSGDTIVLLSNIEYRDALQISDKSITFDLNGFILNVFYGQKSSDSSAGINVRNGALYLKGKGELNVKYSYQSGYALCAYNSIVEITNADGRNGAIGVRAEKGSKVTVKGSASGLTAVSSIGGSEVTIHGNAVGTEFASNRTMGVCANTAKVIVMGDVIAADAVEAMDGYAEIYGNVFGGETYYSSGISAYRNSTVIVHGNVTTAMTAVLNFVPTNCVSSITIHGDIKGSVGVEMGYQGDETITVNGKITASTFLKQFDVVKKESDFTMPTLKTGYKTYYAEKNNAKARLFVRDPNMIAPVLPSGVNVLPTSAALTMNETRQLSATVVPANADDKTVTWTSSNTSVATVSATGLVTAKAAGTATITARTVNNLTAACSITVTAPVTREQNFSFSNKGKANDTFNNSFTTGFAGEATITAPGTDSKTVLSVSIKNASGATVYTGEFNSPAKTGTVQLPMGTYTAVTKIVSANGNSTVSVGIKVVEAAIAPPPPPPPPPPTGPTIALIGSKDIVLHLGGTPYTEQGVTATDAADGDLRSKVVTESNVDISKAGKYTVRYSVTNSSGLSSSITRNVEIVAPATRDVAGKSYTFSPKGKQGEKFTYSADVIVAGNVTMTFTVPNNTSINVVVTNAAGQSVFNDSLSANATRNFDAAQGNYTIAVTYITANGNTTSGIVVATPGGTETYFPKPEVPA